MMRFACRRRRTGDIAKKVNWYRWIIISGCCASSFLDVNSNIGGQRERQVPGISPLFQLTVIMTDFRGTKS